MSEYRDCCPLYGDYLYNQDREGARQIASEDDPGTIYSCPDCEGTGEDFDSPEDGEEFDIQSGKL